MNNGKEPINPQMYTQVGETDFLPLKDGQKTGHERKFGGLTKREYFAAMAMQGILSSRCLQQALNADRKKWEEAAVEHADDLLLELSKTETL